MKDHVFVNDGLSQQARSFKELARDFVAINDMSLEQLLEKIYDYEQQHDCPQVLDKKDIPALVSAIESEADGNAEPSAAIYAIFAKLLEHIQKHLNELPERRIDFYFRKVLGEKPNEAHGDHAHIVFPIEVEDFNYKLPKGTRFTAGTNEEGETIEFESVTNAELNDTQVQKILTLAIPENSAPMFTEIPTYTPEQALESKEHTPYPLFGLTRSGDRVTTSQYARVGLAVSSRLLYLNEGTRRIRVQMVFEEESVKGTLLEKGQSPEQFLRVFSNAFRISLTTEEGWYEAEGYQLESCVLDPQYLPNSIGLIFQIPDMAPSIVNCDPSVHGKDFTMNHPVMRILMTSSSSYNPWKNFRNMVLREVRLQTKVTGCRRLALSSDIGPLSMNTPVQPFGPLPALGNSFVVGCEEIRGKRLSSFEIRGNWRGIPNTRNFCDWYKQYPDAPLTRDFKVSVSALLGGYWYPSSSQTPVLYDLFESHPDSISNKFSITCDSVLGGKSFSQNYDAENFEFTPSSRDGFFKLKLASPEKAFLHQEYSKVLCGSLMHQAIKKNLGAELDLPNQPYTPELENLSVNYTATAEINMRRRDHSDGQIVFLRPWGISTKNHLKLQDGALFLGLSPTAAGKKVNLYFQMNRDSDNIYGEDEIGFLWAYLGTNGWMKLSADNILYNTTANFTTSGIVSLSLPKDFQVDSPMMPQGLCWIRLEPQGEWRHCSSLFSVYAQAVEVVRCGGFGQIQNFSHCKPGSIDTLVESISGISEVYQFDETFGGEPEEDDDGMRTRVAEYLYHRNRVLTAKDCERMILEEFPDVHLVKCFAGLNPKTPDVASPGHMLVVPVSPLYDEGRIWDPCLSGMILDNIKTFLKQRTSAFSKIVVINPQFEKIQVRCNVDFVNDINEGECLLELNEQINHYLSPWNEGGLTQFFGCTLDKERLLMFIQSLPYVEAVQDFSVLRISSKDHTDYHMEETGENNTNQIRGTYPWSILTPMKKHFINVVTKVEEFRDITIGYGDLEVGSTFIIQRRNNG